ncbi:uncharacterized protein LOC105696551 [Orussus abietinus]|uniref:uncharacterized protein LOC105696551 n=1 Tax=Orussus abietinus TaxID=222816 RepID=UPI000626BCA8|nr:uncharacterized protein LOC105696551 [Orussus abietinus]XP_012274539.1 uncharacterized protein LOC105696551 [Orussus abietinus]
MPANGQLWKPEEDPLIEFDVNRDGALDLQEFRALCEKLFGSEEVEKHEDAVKEIFQIFDTDGDDLLTGEEWTRCNEKWVAVVASPVNALLVVDVQNDFIDGTIALRDCGKGEDGADVVEPINRLVKEGDWHKIIYSLDWHPEDHIGFYHNLSMRELHPDSKVSKEEAKLFDTVIFFDPHLEQRLWPRHCVMDSWGAQLHKDLIVASGSAQVRKGQNPDMETYSVFFDNNAVNSTELLDILRDDDVTDVYVCGLAYDICVRATCLDGLRLGYRLAVIDDCCRGVDPDDIAKTRDEISDKGGFLAKSDDVLSLVNGQKRSLIMARQGARNLLKNSSGDPTD